MRDLLNLVGLSLLATSAGVSLVVQATINARLRAQLTSWSLAALVSYLGGSLAMLAVLLIQRAPLPARATLLATSWPTWTGGLFGALYIAMSIILLPRLGAAAVVGFVVAGQMLTSLTVDHFGWLGLPQHTASVPRLLGALLLLAGVVLLRA